MEEVRRNMSKGIELHCLPGFLGQPKDWDEVIPDHLNKRCYDFFSPEAEGQSHLLSLPRAAEWIHLQAAKSSRSKILVGYSFGGRVALHTILYDPGLWRGAVIVSAHPGLSGENSELEKLARLDADRLWAKRFMEEDWQTLMEDWNNQTVFKGGKHRLRESSSYSRYLLAQGLVECSLGTQENLREKLKTLKLPILWISGERDVKFQSLMKELIPLNPRFEGLCIPGAGHRVPWDQPVVFSQALERIYENCKRNLD